METFQHQCNVPFSTAPTSVGAVDMLLHVTRAVCMRKDVAYPHGTSRTWQEHLVQYLVNFLTQSCENSPQLRALQVQVASGMNVLTTAEEEHSTTVVTRFWQQKVWHRLFSKLAPLPGATQAPTLMILALCSLLRSLPPTLLSESQNRLVENVVMAMGFVRDPPAAESDIAAPLSVAGMAALQQLLAVDADLFVPFLNIVVPAVLKVSPVHCVFCCWAVWMMLLDAERLLFFH